MIANTRLMEDYFDRLWPICRSITGDGLRQSLEIISEIIPLQIHEVASGTKVFDWKVPNEWNIRDAYILDPQGRKIADFRENNLHVVNYSVPVDRTLSFEELSNHIHTCDSDPDAVPYVTSYYREYWGFCLAQNEFASLPRHGKYKVFIDSSLEAGSLTYGDLIIPGQSTDEILISTYLCHPSMANNELSGPLVTAFLYSSLMDLPSRHYTYRFIFGPETIGAITYLAEHGKTLRERVRGGYVVTCVGDDVPFTYKRSRIGDCTTDRITEYVFNQHGFDREQIVDFFPGGSDERQYCSPGFNLPLGSVMRSMYGSYAEYHTSKDDKSFISFDAMAGSVELYLELLSVFESNRYYKSLNPFCEPQLGKRGLYNNLGAQKKKLDTKAIQWTLNLADGSQDLLSIAERSGIDYSIIAETAVRLRDKELLEVIDKGTPKNYQAEIFPELPAGVSKSYRRGF